MLKLLSCDWISTCERWNLETPHCRLEIGRPVDGSLALREVMLVWFPSSSFFYNSKSSWDTTLRLSLMSVSAALCSGGRYTKVHRDGSHWWIGHPRIPSQWVKRWQSRSREIEQRGDLIPLTSSPQTLLSDLCVHLFLRGMEAADTPKAGLAAD